MSTREFVLERIRGLHEGATLEEIREQIETLIAIEEGLENFRQGQVYSHQQVLEMSESWTTQRSGQTVP